MYVNINKSIFDLRNEFSVLILLLSIAAYVDLPNAICIDIHDIKVYNYLRKAIVTE